MSTGIRIAISVIIIYKAGAIIQECRLLADFFNRVFVIVIEVIGSEIHFIVEESPGTIHTTHPGGADTVALSPTALSTAHSTAASTHSTHHGTRKVVKTTVISIITVQDKAQLALVGKSSGKCRSLVSPVTITIRSVLRPVMTSTCHHISEDAVHHTLLDGKVYHGLLLSVVNASELCLVRFFLNDFHLVDNLGRNVLGSELRIIQEECLSVDSNLGYSLSVSCNRAIFRHFHARKFLKKILENIIVSGLE